MRTPVDRQIDELIYNLDLLGDKADKLSFNLSLNNKVYNKESIKNAVGSLAIGELKDRLLNIKLGARLMQIYPDFGFCIKDNFIVVKDFEDTELCFKLDYAWKVEIKNKNFDFILSFVCRMTRENLEKFKKDIHEINEKEN